MRAARGCSESVRDILEALFGTSSVMYHSRLGASRIKSFPTTYDRNRQPIEFHIMIIADYMHVITIFLQKLACDTF